jgi:hypothetical protein
VRVGASVAEFFPSRIPDPNLFIPDLNFSIPDPGSKSKNLSFLPQTIVSKLSEI